jgi:hypothetical protein
MNRYIMMIGMTFGFAIGFFVALTVFALLQTDMTLGYSTYRQCYRTEFVIQIMDLRSLAYIFMGC